MRRISTTQLEHHRAKSKYTSMLVEGPNVRSFIPSFKFFIHFVRLNVPAQTDGVIAATFFVNDVLIVGCD